MFHYIFFVYNLEKNQQRKYNEKCLHNEKLEQRLAFKQIVSENYFDAVIYTDDAKTGADGEFEFSYPLEHSEEPQSFVVMLADSGKSYTSRISYIDAGYPDRALANINAAVEEKKRNIR